MDLIGGYLLILMVLFTANIALMIGNYEINNIKLIICSFVFSIISFLIMHVSGYLNTQFAFLLDNFSYLFLIIAILIFLSMLHYVKNNELRMPLSVILITFLLSVILFASQASLDFFNILTYSLLSFIILFVVYQLTKLLHHAKRQYSVIIGEYMCLFSILVFIFAVTYNSTVNLDYTMFSSFLILTPTYQLIYVIIAVVVTLIAGMLLNDSKGGNS